MKSVLLSVLVVLGSSIAFASVETPRLSLLRCNFSNGVTLKSVRLTTRGVSAEAWLGLALRKFGARLESEVVNEHSVITLTSRQNKDQYTLLLKMDPSVKARQSVVGTLEKYHDIGLEEEVALPLAVASCDVELR